jgi:hypothetical protein
LATQKFLLPTLTRESEAPVRAILASLDGVLYAAASACDRCAEVEFDDDIVTTDTMRKALQAIGFEARLAG